METIIRKFIVIIVVVGTVVFLLRQYGVEDLAENAHEAIEEGLEHVTGDKAMEIADQAREQFKKDSLKRAMKQYENLRGQSPQDLEDLVKEGLLKKADLVDEWGRSLRVEVTTEGIVVRSAGRDGRFHTRDDWSLGES